MGGKWFSEVATSPETLTSIRLCKADYSFKYRELPKEDVQDMLRFSPYVQAEESDEECEEEVTGPLQRTKEKNNGGYYK